MNETAATSSLGRRPRPIGISDLPPEDAVGEGVPTVMIVDDDPGVVRALSSRCRRIGLNVLAADGGLQAILMAKQNFPNVLIVDINMPEVDGFKVCEWLLNPARPPLNVIALTGNRDYETIERCDALGAFYVPKSSDTWTYVRSILSRLLGLNLPPEDAPSQIVRPDMPRQDLLPTAGPRILLVDDDLDMITAMRSRLRKLGATVFVADNGVDAYRIASRERPHAVITDYVMPNGGGHYLVWRLRELRETARIPIFIISGEIETDERPLPRLSELVGPKGATRVFRKPFEFEDLVEDLRAHCPMLSSGAGAWRR